MENLEKLKSLVNQAASKWTAKDREFVVGLAADFGVKINTLCKNCYIDAAVEIYDKMTRETQPMAEAGGYALRAGTDVILHAHGGAFRVCAATLTVENARVWLALGLPKEFFETIPDEDNGTNKME